MKFGYYMDTDDVRQLMGPLLCLLDGRRDVPFPEDTVKKKKGIWNLKTINAVSYKIFRENS